MKNKLMLAGILLTTVAHGVQPDDDWKRDAYQRNQKYTVGCRVEGIKEYYQNEEKNFYPLKFIRNTFSEDFIKESFENIFSNNVNFSNDEAMKNFFVLCAQKIISSPEYRGEDGSKLEKDSRRLFLYQLVEELDPVVRYYNQRVQDTKKG